MRETSKKRIIQLIKEVKFPAFPGGAADVSVEHQLPEHAFEAIADHLVANSITSLPHIKLLEATEKIGPYELEKVILFNSNHISQEEAIHCFETEEDNPDVVILTKAQWVMMFRDGKEM